MSMTEDALHYALRLLRNFRLQQLPKSNQDMPSMLAEENSILSIETRNPINLLKIRRAPEPSPLIYLIRSLHQFQATDPRDKVFALLGIASDAEALGLCPNYRKSCEEVYVDLAQTLVQNGYIEILSLCEFLKQIACLPSWVPDWSQKGSRSPLQQRALDRSARPLTTILQPNFSASGSGSTINPRIWNKIDRIMPVLLLPAIFLGEVQRLGAAWEHEGVGRWLNDSYELSDTTSKSPVLSEGQTHAVWRTAVADMEIRQGAKKPRLSKETTRRVHSALKKADLSVANPQTLIRVGLGDYCNQLQEIAQGRRPLLASGGYLGIGPRETEAGDLLFILHGADVPFILRPHHDDNETLRLVGEAYVHGIMDGEVMEGSPLIKTISLS